MKKTIAAIAFLFAATTAASASAQEGGWTQEGGLYLSGHGLVMNPRGTNETASGNDSWDYDLGFGGIAAIGYAFIYPDYGSDLRFEVEGSYRRAANNSIQFADGTYWDISEGNTIVTSIMFNVLVDFHTQTRLTPYLGAGIGRSRIAFDEWTVTQTDPSGFVSGFVLPEEHWDVTSWQGIAGVSYSVSKRLNLDFEYRFFQPNDTSFNGFISNEFTLGFRLTF